MQTTMHDLMITDFLKRIHIHRGIMFQAVYSGSRYASVILESHLDRKRSGMDRSEAALTCPAAIEF